MNQDDVMALFLEESERPCRTLVRQDDSLSILAKVIADSTDTLSVENFDALIHIGGTMYKTWAAQAKARSELTSTMQESIIANIAHIESPEQR
jgi:hypothetical protein